jgi:DNA helicase-2/ATP-dependent DNA helicase PcrA
MRSAYVSLNYGDAWKACNEYLHKNMGLLSEREFILTIEAARKIIDNYQSIPAPAYYKYLTEFPIRNVVMNGVPLKGNIDRIDVYEGKAMINDYKTGSLSTMLTKLKPPSEKNTFGGDMWRQAKFYEQLCKHNQSLPWRVHGVTFIHMGDDVITPIIVEEIFDHDKLFSDLIQDTYNKIKAIEFSSCNDSDCLWCNLNKQ